MFPSLTDNFPLQFVVCQVWETMWDHGCHAVCYVSHTVCQSECQTQCASQYVTHSVSFSVSVSTLIDKDWECSHTMLQSNFRVSVQCGHNIFRLLSNSCLSLYSISLVFRLGVDFVLPLSQEEQEQEEEEPPTKIYQMGVY